MIFSGSRSVRLVCVFTTSRQFRAERSADNHHGTQKPLISDKKKPKKLLCNFIKYAPEETSAFNPVSNVLEHEVSK